MESDKIQCLECGNWYKWITANHILSCCGMTKIEYLEKYNLTKTDLLSEKTLKNKSEAQSGSKNSMFGRDRSGINAPFLGCKHTEESKNKLSISHKKYYENGGKPWNKGLRGIYSEETLKQMSESSKKENLSDETRLKMSESQKGKKRHTEEWKKQASLRNKGKNNPNFGKVTYNTGRCKWFDYKSPIAGNVKLQGTYELRMAKILDKLNFNWERNKDYFIYDDGNHSYIPDFKINGDVIWYIDTKGWFSEQDQNKIRDVRENHNIILNVVTKELLEQYENGVK